VAQIVAGIAASAAVKSLIPGKEVLFAVQLSAGTTVTQGFFLEMLFTVELVFTILMLAAEVCGRLCYNIVILNADYFLENENNIHRPSWNWARAVCGRIVRGVLDGWRSEPSQGLRASRRQKILWQRTLVILYGRTRIDSYTTLSANHIICCQGSAP